MNPTTTRKLMNIISLMGLVATVSLTIYWWRLGVFDDLSQLQLTIGRAHHFAPLVFILIQLVQVVLPIIPGGISLAAGVLIFGPVWGFVYNYVGICLGSMVNFFLAKQYGKPLIQSLLPPKTFAKYSGFISNEKRFSKLFALAIFLPVAPDDALCLLAGLTEMSFKKFALIICLGKPVSVAAYSVILVNGFQFLQQFLPQI